jgi:hypothetical protein
MEPVRSSQISENVYQTAWRHISEDSTLHAASDPIHFCFLNPATPELHTAAARMREKYTL